MKKVVIVDDFEESCQLISDILSTHFECKYICQAKDAIEFIKKEKPDLILMDYKMPYVTGVELCKTIKENTLFKDIPIIFISGAVSSDERIETLEAGGDDFLSKPFHPKELLLRVQKRLNSKSKNEQVVVEVGNLRLNVDSRQCFINTSEVILTPKQFEILKLLIENKSKMVSRQTFMSEIWGHFEVTPRNVDSQINYLKKKLEGFAGSITAVPSYGYRLDLV